MQFLDAITHQAPVDFKLGFAGPTQTDTALLPLKVSPAAHQARGQMHQLRQFDLQFSFVTACALQSDFRAFTYGPSFAYIEKEQVQKTMWRLGDDVAALDQLMDDEASEVAGGGSADGGTAGNPGRQAEVVRLIEDMQAAAAQISTTAETTNHPKLDRNLKSFQMELALARDAAAKTPPRYFRAGAISGSCLACHAGRTRRPN